MSEDIANVAVLVPVEPTEDMLVCGLSGGLSIALGGPMRPGLREIWAAMVEAGQIAGEIPNTSDRLDKSAPPRSQAP